jgi:hypothetical protein
MSSPAPVLESASNDWNGFTFDTRRPAGVDHRAAIALFFLLSLVLLVLAPGILRYVFPVAALVTGYLIQRRSESCYASFAIWLYLLTPLLRRLVDYRDGFVDPSTVLLAPLVVTALCLPKLSANLKGASVVLRSATLLALGAVLYGLFVAIIRQPTLDAFLAAVNWSSPIAFGLFVAASRERAVNAAIIRTSYLGVLVVGVYGIYQYFVSPPWDVYWLEHLNAGAGAAGFGGSAPMQMRVWSTMNSPGTLAVFVGACLIWSLASDNRIALCCCIPGYVSLMLTSVRGMWIETAISVIIFAVLSGARGLRTLLISVAAVAASVLIVTQLGLATPVSDRLSTLTDVSHDASANDRIELYRVLSQDVLATPAGIGLRSAVQVHGEPLDSGLIKLFVLCGWLGASLYLTALIMIAATMIRNARHADPLSAAASAIFLVDVGISIFGGDMMTGAVAVRLWMSAGLWFRQHNLYLSGHSAFPACSGRSVTR